VATLFPFVEDALAGSGDKISVVASVRRSMHVPVAEGVVDLGNPHSPNFEKLAESRAHLVIGDRNIHGRFAEAIARLEAEVLLLDASSVEGTLRALESVSAALGGDAVLTKKIAAARSAIDAVKLSDSVSILALFGSPGSFFATSDRVWLGDLATRIGFENVAVGEESHRFPGLVPVSDEIMALMRPDLVVLVAHGDPEKIRADLIRKTKRGGPWVGLARARYGIRILDPALFSANPGLEMGRAAKTLKSLVQNSDGNSGP